MRDASKPAELGFITVFLGLGFDRLSDSDKNSAAPALLAGIHTFPNTHKALCLRLFVKVRRVACCWAIELSSSRLRVFPDCRRCRSCNYRH